MISETKVFTYPNGEIQRVQVVRMDSWDELQFLELKGTESALDRFAGIYRKYLVPACPWLFGNMVMFRLPEDISVSGGFPEERLAKAAELLRRGVVFLGGKPLFRSEEAKGLYQALEQRDCLRLVRGRLPMTTPIPVKDVCGHLTEAAPQARLKVNASFFIMDRFDCATAYDHVGTHLGLCVKDGVVRNPPLYGREALLVDREGRICVRPVKLEELTLRIGEETYTPGVNARLYTRPRRCRTPRSADTKLLIVGCRVVAVSRGTSVPIPASGFVLSVPGSCSVRPGDAVVYEGMEDIIFGIQVGNSILREGEKTLSFISRFYNIRHFEPIPFPPSLYPMDFNRARAARIALGADVDGRPMLLWAEGAGKNRYVPGEDSCGASLREMADICESVGMVNAVNLDGGGSAQILVNNRRCLMISDRKAEDNSEAERPIPFALMVS